MSIPSTSSGQAPKLFDVHTHVQFAAFQDDADSVLRALGCIPPLCYALFMELFLAKYIEKALEKATYEYDESVKQWAAWIEEVPGVYAQASTVEAARKELASVLEDYVLLSLSEGKRVPGFVFPKSAKRVYAKVH